MADVSLMLGEASKDLGRHSTKSWMGRVKADEVKPVLSYLRQRGANPRAIYRDRSGKRRYYRSSDSPSVGGWCLRRHATHADIYDRGERRRAVESLIQQLLAPVTEASAEVVNVYDGLSKLGWKLENGVAQYDDGDGTVLTVAVEEDSDGVLTAYASGEKTWPYETKHGEGEHTEEFEIEDTVNNVDDDGNAMPLADFVQLIDDTFRGESGPSEPRLQPDDAVGADYGYRKSHPMDRF